MSANSRSTFESTREATAKESARSACVKRVREALEAGGGITTGYPRVAKAWGATLKKMGFRELFVEDPETFSFIKGDIVVIQPYPDGNDAGHIAGYDGKQWISDYIQRDFWSGPGYRKYRPKHVFYRP